MRYESLAVGILVFVLASSSAAVARGEVLDDSWTVTVNGQTVRVNPNGSFRIDNIPSPDLFGPDGPGSAPDFVGDDYVQVIATRTVGGVTEYAFSEPFRIRNGETFRVPELISAGMSPPPMIVGLEAEPLDRVVTSTTEIDVTATLADPAMPGVEREESSLDPDNTFGEWVLYRTSNPAIARVDENGVVVATGNGTAFITATSRGATAVAEITVSAGDPLTAVSGVVVDADMSPVAGAQVTINPGGLQAVTDAGGSFAMGSVLTEFGPISGHATGTVDVTARR